MSQNTRPAEPRGACEAPPSHVTIAAWSGGAVGFLSTLRMVAPGGSACLAAASVIGWSEKRMRL